MIEEDIKKIVLIIQYHIIKLMAETFMELKFHKLKLMEQLFKLVLIYKQIMVHLLIQVQH